MIVILTREGVVMGIIISDEIEKECLNLLALYTDREYCKRHILTIYRNLSDYKQSRVSSRIKSYVEQAMSFLSETDQNMYSAPLTLFYSINNFSKAVFYANRPNETIAGKHGIDLFQKDNEIEKIKELGDIRIVVNSKGAFSSLINITGDSLNTGDVISLKDIFSLMPELRELYYARYLEEPNVYLLRPIGVREVSYDVIFQTSDLTGVRSRDFSLMHDNSMHIEILGQTASIWGGGNATKSSKSNTTYADIFGNTYCTNGISINSKRVKISKMVSLYICYYAFGMMVRYHPDVWKVFCESADIGIIRKLLSNCRREMLVEVLQLMNGEKYSFTTKIEPVEEPLDGTVLLKVLRNELSKEKKRTGRNILLDI